MLFVLQIAVKADSTSWRLEDWIEQVGLDTWLEEADEARQEEFIETLNALHQNPIDLNRASWEELNMIPFLTALQVDRLATYLYYHVPLTSLQELLIVEGWGQEAFRRVEPFVCLSPLDRQPDRTPEYKETFRDWVSKGHSTVRLKLSSTLQHKAGYADSDSLRELSKAYLGNPLSASARFLYKYGKHLTWGISAEKDRGEKGVDFVTGHAQVREVGILNNLVIGDYKIAAGQGLILSSGIFGGKTMSASQQHASEVFFKPHTSTSESGFQRGVGVELASHNKRWRGAGFVSYRRIDTSREGDTFTSIKTDGFHSTVSDTIKKGNTKQLLTGGRLRYAGEKLQLAVNALYFRMDGYWQPEEKPYNLFYFRGNEGWNASVDVRLLLGGWLFSGELATGTGNGMAGIVQVSRQLHPKVDAFFSARVYAPQYQAPFGSAFGVNGSTANENGIYAQVDCRLIPFVEIVSYLDYYYFPWLKYRVNRPSEGLDFGIEATWSPSRNFQCALRYRMKRGEENLPTGSVVGIVPLQTTCKRQIKAQLTYSFHDIRLKTTLNGNRYNQGGEEPSWGFSLSQDVRFAREEYPLSAACQWSLFDADSYDNRLYVSGPDLAGTMPFSSVYGRGGRLSLLLCWNISKSLKWDIVLKHTVYEDRETIGTGLETIEGNRSTYVGTALRIKI